jgi:hypothetical protein
VAGLESIFTYEQTSQEDAALAFKVRHVGAAYYAKHVDARTLQQQEPPRKKLTVQQMMAVLRILYGLRSSIAHGEWRLDFFQDKRTKQKLNRLFSHLGVGAVNEDTPSIYYGHLLLALGLFEVHVLALFRSAIRQLEEGAGILVQLIEELDTDAEVR